MSTKKTKLENRDTLKNYFKNGSRPTASNFSSLIDSMINKADDGISKTRKDGLILAPEGEESDTVMSFSNKVGDLQGPNWSIALQQGANPGLGIMQPISPTESETRLFFNKDGNIGVHTQEPKTNFDVHGVLGVESRVGTYVLSTVPADGNWHDIITGLDGCNAFEIMAQVGKEKTGKYALLHANALSTFGRSRNRIRKTQAHYGWWWNKLSLRWRGSTYNYKLQIKTRSNYGKNQEIKFFATRLWDNDIMLLFNQKQ